MNELWRKPDVVYIDQFDASMYPALMKYQQNNEEKESVEDKRKDYFDRQEEDQVPLTEEECNYLREKLGASFVLESYKKKELKEMLTEKGGKQKRKEKER